MKNNIIRYNDTIELLWKGSILASIAHAIMVAHYPELSHEHSWDGNNYNIQDSEGSRGTISFKQGYCFCAIYNDKSNDVLNVEQFLKDAPEKVIDLAIKDTLQYLLQKTNGNISPIISSAFWGENNVLYSKISFDKMMSKGGFILKKQFQEYNLAVESWAEYYEMTDEQISLMETLYNKKIESYKSRIDLTKNDINMIGIESKEGLNESIISFDEINIGLAK